MPEWLAQARHYRKRCKANQGRRIACPTLQCEPTARLDRSAFWDIWLVAVCKKTAPTKAVGCTIDGSREPKRNSWLRTYPDEGPDVLPRSGPSAQGGIPLCAGYYSSSWRWLSSLCPRHPPSPRRPSAA